MGDWSSPQYVVSQIFVAVSYALFWWTYTTRNRYGILSLVIIGNAFYGVAFFLLGSYVGMGISIIAIVRDIVQIIIKSFRNERNEKKFKILDTALLPLWILAPFVVTLFTFDTWTDWFPFVSTALFALSIWQKKVIVYRICGVVSSGAWIPYQVSIENVIGTVLESCSFTVAMTSTIVFLTKVIIVRRRAGRALRAEKLRLETEAAAALATSGAVNITQTATPTVVSKKPTAPTIKTLEKMEKAEKKLKKE